MSEPFLYGTLGQATPSDLPSLAASVAALACALSRPERPVAPLALLSLAGLWRPEPWLIAVLYWAWAGRGLPRQRRAMLGLLALSAPLIWVVGDLVMTHNPLYSLTYTRESTLAARRPTGLGHVPGALRSVLVSYLGAPALIAALAGVALELFVRRLPRAMLLLLALSVLSFALIGAMHLPLDERYALPTIALLAVFFGQLVAGWWTLPRSRLRHLWMAVGVLAAAVVAASVPHQLQALARDRATFRQESAAVADLGALTRAPGVRAELRSCPRLPRPTGWCRSSPTTSASVPRPHHAGRRDPREQRDGPTQQRRHGGPLRNPPVPLLLAGQTRLSTARAQRLLEDLDALPTAAGGLMREVSAPPHAATSLFTLHSICTWATSFSSASNIETRTGISTRPSLSSEASTPSRSSTAARATIAPRATFV